MSSVGALYSLILTHLLLRLLDHLFYDSVVDPLGLAIHALADVSTSRPLYVAAKKSDPWLKLAQESFSVLLQCLVHALTHACGAHVG